MCERTWPPPTLLHLRRLTDDCGIIQHAKYWAPDYSTGYCVDDNSRALIVACHHFRLFGDELAHELMVRYLAFIFYVQRRDGKVRNFIDYTRNFLEDEGSPDSLGRTIWALGHVATVEEDYLSIPAREMLHRALPHLLPGLDPHALAYGTLGLCAYGTRVNLREEAQRLVRPLVGALLERWQRTRSEEWEWFLPTLTYDNGRLSQALLRAGLLLGSDELIAAGLRSLDFLNSVCYRDGYLCPVGCHGWYPRGGHCAMFDQQPIDAAGMVEVNLSAYHLTDQAAYLDYAGMAMDWFYGANSLRVPLYNPLSGGCHDGLLVNGVNCNQGAESTIAYLMAQLHLYEAAPHLFTCPLPELPDDCDNTGGKPFSAAHGKTAPPQS